MDIQITTAKDKILSIPVTNGDLIDHFIDPNNCTEIILKQINEEKVNLKFHPEFETGNTVGNEDW